MAFRTLIDGYNLLFEAGFGGRGRGPRWLEKARQTMLQHLAKHVAAEQHCRTLIVFDASGPAQGTYLKPDQVDINHTPSASGLQVVYAGSHEEADDLMERLIRQHSAPKSLTVVSSDHRIHRAALARRCTVLDSTKFLDLIESSTIKAPPQKTEPESPDREPPLDPHEVEHWLREFQVDSKSRDFNQ